MKDESAFKTWLEQGGAQTEKGRNSRLYAVRTIESNLSALGFPCHNLEEAWDSDQFTGLRERLKAMRDDARSGGEDYRILMPNSEKPLNRLSSWGSWVAQYGRFLAGEPPGSTKDADRIRQYVLEHYIETGREEGNTHVEVLVRDVNNALNLNQAWPNICQALTGKKFQELAELAPPEQIGADQSSATVFRFDLNPAGVNRSALENLRQRFLTLCPDFVSFVEPGEGQAKGEKAYKLAASERISAALSEQVQDDALGKAVVEILKTAAKDGPFVRWQTEDKIAKETPELLGEFYTAIGALLRSDHPAQTALSDAFDALGELRSRGATSLTYGERLNIVFSALAMTRPSEAVPLKITRINEAWEVLTTEKLFVESKADMLRDYRRFAEVFSNLFEIMRDEWHWRPQDWLDIQGFLWIALDKSLPESSLSPVEGINPQETENPQPMTTTNLILYGPPGTGKTYHSATEALRLCGEPVPADRNELMTAYQSLAAAGRIEFVTFHQSMAYEEFVEGRQPVTGSEEGEDGATAGFRLETVPGIFRRIARRAEASRGSSGAETRLSLDGRQVFKMSIGAKYLPEDAPLFDEAIEKGCAIFGFYDFDLSDPRFSSREEIREAAKARHEADPEAHFSQAATMMTNLFRNEVKEGDVLIVTKGNLLVRAIGIVTGGYEFAPREGSSDYAHRRAVDWLWTDKEGIAASDIYDLGLVQRTIYQLDKTSLNIPAVERYMNSQRAEDPAAPEPFVLIIDEINRANISKVFGELITLLEPDKRLGQPGQIKLRLPYSRDEFGVPANLHIIGTMNTADRSIALLDTALRRRFSFREMMPEPSVLAEAAAKTGMDLPGLLRTINERIEYLYDREHQIGHAYFITCTTRADVDAVMRDKVIPLLAEYFFEDWAKIAAVLGDLEAHEGEVNGGFLTRSVLKAPPGLDDGEAMVRFRWNVRAGSFDYTRLIGA